MNTIIPILILPVILPLFSTASIPQLSTKPVTFTVTDPSGKPVAGAVLEASRPGPGNASGITAEDGTATLDLARGATLHLHATRDGYYATSGELWTGGLHREAGGQMTAREIPDAFTVVLKPVVDPVPLLRTRHRGRVPVTDEPVGFDLQAGDWLAPYGNGKLADIFFQFHGIVLEQDSFEGTMTISFPNEGDGIQSFIAARPFSREFGSNLGPPHRAPDSGYVPTLSYTLEHTEGEPFEGYTQKQRNYLLRTRTEMDAGGVIRKACYGWILGEIEFDPRDAAGPQLSFTAYINPDPAPEARSLENAAHQREGS
jgi:hypothetical protein